MSSEKTIHCHRDTFHTILDVMLCLLFAGLVLIICVQKNSGKALPTIFGWGQATVVSGSMEPTIRVGSMILVQEYADYAPGDIVVYLGDDGKLIVHRLMSVEGDVAITKGDANVSEDEPIRTSQILGTVKAVIPVLGQTFLLLGDPWVVSIILAASILLWFLPQVFKRKRIKQQKSRKDTL